MARVTAPSSRLVFCEGDLDSVLLHQIIPTGKAEIKATGGKHGMRAFIEGHLFGYGTSQPVYLGFRDRDFDAEPPDTPQLIRLLPATKPIWMSYRACIESYFIDSQLLHDYWTESAVGPAWGHGAPPTVEVIEEHILRSARELAEYQAIRWALAKLKPGTRWPEVETTWTEGSGHLPTSLAYDICLTEARKLVDGFVSQASNVSLAELDDKATAYRDRFKSEDFYSRREYLAWYHGKDLLAYLTKHLTPSFPSRHYSSWAASHVDFGRHPDLRQLVEMCA
jgi:hypothetical protein